MKILLTADWHLKAKHPYSDMVPGYMWDRLCNEKLNVLRRMAEYTNKLKVDLIVVAGDVFDTSNPPEALKAEVVKVFQLFDLPVRVITGRPGDHDFVNPQNFVLMDIREALINDSKIYIHDKNFYEDEQIPKTLFYHNMLDGINEFYKKTVKMSDEKFSGYNTILMGDYHSYWHKQYANKDFIYSGPPYPTRFGEESAGFVIADISDSGKLNSHKFYRMKTFRFVEFEHYTVRVNGKEGQIQPFIAKIKMEVDSNELSLTLRKCEMARRELMENPLCIDVVWDIKSCSKHDISTGINNSDSLSDMCLKYIEENAGDGLKKYEENLFKKLEKEVV